MRRDTPNGTRFGMGKGETGILPEAVGVDVGERKKTVREIGKDGTRCKCGWKVISTDRVCPNCGALLSRGGEILPVRENKKPITTDKLTKVFVSSGAVEMKHPVSNGSEVESDPAGSHDLEALEAALGGASGVEGEIKKDWDPEIARVIDVRGKQPQGLVKKKQK